MIGFFDMFSGIGGFRAGLERDGGFECVGHCEIDKYADAAYRAVHNVKESETFHTVDNAVAVNVVYEFGLRLKAAHAAYVAAICANQEEAI